MRAQALAGHTALAALMLRSMNPFKPGFPMNHSNRPALPSNTLKPRKDKGKDYMYLRGTRFIVG